MNCLRLIPIILFFLLCIGCDDDSQDRNYQRKSDCSAPKSIGIDDFIVTTNQMDGLKFIWNKVDGVLGYEFKVNVNNDLNPLVSSMIVTDTFYSIVSLFQIDDHIKAQVRSVCDRDTKSDWVDIEVINRNGGATVDDVPGLADWNYVCNVSPCEYVRFIDNEVITCEGDVIELDLNEGRKSFYLKSDVCPCIYQNTLCEGLQNITECLHTPYLKRNYTVCN